MMYFEHIHNMIIRFNSHPFVEIRIRLYFVIEDDCAMFILPYSWFDIDNNNNKKFQQMKETKYCS